MSAAADPQELRRDFFDACPKMLCILDREGRVVLANRAWEESMGAAPESVVERAPEEAREALRGALSSERRGAWRGMLRAAGGDVAPFHIIWAADDRELLHVSARRIPREELDAEAQRLVLEERTRLLNTVLSEGPLVLWSINREGKFTFSAGSGLRHLGLVDGQVVGMSIYDLYRDFPSLLRNAEEAFAGASISFSFHYADRDWQVHVSPLRSDAGEVIGVLGLSIDATEQGRLERELREHIGMLTQQKDMIRAMSTPILQVWDGVLALPVVGHVDQERAEALMNALLDEIVRTGSRHAILDVTGVEALDTTTVHHIARLLRAVRLLGAEGILTGVRPAVAQTLVALGEDLPEAPTLRNLQAGLQRCLKAVTARPPRR